MSEINLEGRIMALEAKHTAHEILCAERWGEAKKVMNEARADIKAVLDFQAKQVGQLKGAIMATRIFWAIIGAVAAAALWILKSMVALGR